MTNEELLMEIIDRYRALYKAEQQAHIHYQRQYESLREHYNEKVRECRKTCDKAGEEE